MHPTRTVHQLDPNHLPVVSLGGINLVRALGLAGIQAVVATTDPEEPALASRYCAAGILLPPRDPIDAHVDALANLGKQLAGKYGRRVPLVYGSDEALEMLHSHRQRLERFFLFLLNAPEVAEALIAKDRFQAFAEAHDLPVPRALAWNDGSLRRHPGPVAIKPRAKQNWHQSVMCQQLFGGDGKARVFESGAAAAKDPTVAVYKDQLTFQEYIPGGDEELWSYHGYANECGEVLAGFVGRKIRTYPVGMGESAFIELARNEELERLGRDIARRLPLCGPFKMDVKRDPGTGRFYLLEINARYTLWHLVGALNGVNLMRVAYDYLLRGEHPVARRYRTSHRWISMELDYRAFRELKAQGQLGLVGWLRSIVLSRNAYNLFSWSDPMPWATRQLARVRRLANGTSRFAFLLRPWRSTAS